MLADQKSNFSVVSFSASDEGSLGRGARRILVRYNRNGIELNQEGFQKLSEEIALESIETKLDLPWGKETVTLFYGEVPMGETVELLVLRRGTARELLQDGKLGSPSEHSYYEVCTAPAFVRSGRRLDPHQSICRSCFQPELILLTRGLQVQTLKPGPPFIFVYVFILRELDCTLRK